LANTGIIFKGRKNGLAVILNKDADFATLKENLRAKAAGGKKFFNAANTAVSFVGRELSKAEEAELLKILADETGVVIAGPKPEAVKQKKPERIEPEPAPREPETYGDGAFFHNGSLRSGQAINYKGSVVVIGDVNPGGEIIAEGSVIVLGAMKGMVHAGCGGDRTRFVFALRFTPTQLRIADTISYIPPEMFKKEKGLASYAYVSDGQIFIKRMLD